MTEGTAGLHHVTAIAGRARANLDFYGRVLGLRFVKRTVNFDDPGSYHFYYGDEAGRPGTLVTFFAWEQAAPGQLGVGVTRETALRVPAASFGYWTQRLVAQGVAHEAPEKRFGESVLPFTDPDGLKLALVGVPGAESEPAWAGGEVPAEHAVRGLAGVTLLLDDAGPTAAVLANVLGFSEAGREGPRIRYRTGDGLGSGVDLHQAGGFFGARVGRGSVHHVAFRAPDVATQATMARRLADEHGLWVTEPKDRRYFRSVYFREPGGVLFEIATDAPGFTVDEPLDALGSALKLPPFLEPQRRELEGLLPSLDGAA